MRGDASGVHVKIGKTDRERDNETAFRGKVR